MNSQILLKINSFLSKRLIELVGISLISSAILILMAVITYSPSDPNFLYSPEYTEINNVLGFQGSLVADFFLQSVGFISFLILFTLIIWGFKLILAKKINNILPKIFFLIIYTLSGTAFISINSENSFWLIDNGNGGFVGSFLKDTLYTLTSNFENQNFSLLLFFVAVFFFFLSLDINFKNYLKIIKLPYKLVSKILSLFQNTKKQDDEVSFYSEDESKKQKDHSSKSTQPNLPLEVEKEKMTNNKFKTPPLSFLEKQTNQQISKNNNEIKLGKDSEFLEKILLDFGVEGKIKRISRGPVVTLNEFEPAPGIKVSKIINLSDDIARNTSSISTRVSTIPGKNTVGIEIPNPKRENVFLSEIISEENFLKKENKLPIALGKSISGVPIISDLSAMPHLLVAGTTGSGKSVCINSIIMSLLYKHTPNTCNFILVDPKMLELSTYEGIPHLLCPVITEAKKATAALGWTVREMENRYKLMTKLGVKNIDGYNLKNKRAMPYIVLIVDEMSDLMLVAGKEIENYIQKLSQMARAAGIHIIMATQRPSVDVITGTIKANFPTRISFQVSSKIDSRTILGEQGAEQLLGKGDMLFMSAANRMTRIHGPFVSEKEIEKVNSFLRSQGEPNYFEEITVLQNENEYKETGNDETKDELYSKAIEIVKQEKKASTSFLQRKLQIGYNRAARIMEMMEEEGIVGQANHVGKREIL